MLKELDISQDSTFFSNPVFDELMSENNHTLIENLQTH